MARLIEELKKLPASAPRARSGSPSTSCAPQTTMPPPWPKPCASQDCPAPLLHLQQRHRLDPCIYCASTTTQSTPGLRVEEPTSIESVERTRGYQGVLPRAARNAFAAAWRGPRPVAHHYTCWPAWSAARSMKSSLPPAPRSKARPQPTGWPPPCAAIRSGSHASPRASRRSDIEYARRITMARAMDGRREL